MPRIDPDTTQLAIKTFKREKILTLPKLASILGCSTRTAQTKLNLWNTYTSYNKNGKYYTLPEIPQFNHHGLWWYKDVAFSKNGNLKKTIIHLIIISPSGLTGKQLGDLLGLVPQSFLHHFRDCPGICREKHDGVYVYFANNASVYEKQVQQRRSIIHQSSIVTISVPEAILILVAIIKHHSISAQDILTLPEIKKSKIQLIAIQNFLESHGLVKKESGFKALKLLKEFVGRAIAITSVDALFSKKPTIHFYPEIHECSTCSSMLHTQKTRMKTVVTMEIGAFHAKETVLFCPYDHKTFFSELLRSLVPEGGTFGFDVIVEVGLALFVHCRNNQETMKELAAKNVFPSEREISYLGRKFIVYLALAHKESQPGLKNLIARRGGYILHIDGTCEGDSPNLFCGLDGISELVLDTIKIPSEKKDHLIPFFKRIKEQYGEPRAIVHDMGQGILAAIEDVFPSVADFICHFHFLRDIGKDLLLDEYIDLQKRLRKFKIRSLLRQKAKYLEQKINPTSQTIDEIIASFYSGVWQTTSFEHIPLITTYALIHWVFDYPSQSSGYGFPFDKPHLDFYRRMQKIYRLLGEIMDIHLRGLVKDNKPFLQVYKTCKEVVEDSQLNELAAGLEQKAEVFNKLRTAMRIALPEGKNGINDNGDNTNIKSIEEKVTAFRNGLVRDECRKTTYASMIAQLDKYWVKLFADPLLVVTPTGVRYIQPQRTNNILERFFRGEKRRGRKKSGMASLNMLLKTGIKDTPLVQNLKNSEYMEIILNGSSSLAERFSQIDAHLIHKEMEEAKNNNDMALPAIRKLVKDSELTTKISALFSHTQN